MSLFAAARPGTGHSAFRAWLTSAEAAAPSAEIAGHFAACAECRNAVAALDSLRAIDPTLPDLPAPATRAEPEAAIWAWARYAVPLAVIFALALGRPYIGAVLAPHGDLFQPIADPEQGILGDWWSAFGPDPGTGFATPTDEAVSPVAGASGGSPQPSLAPGIVPSAGATPAGVGDPSTAPFTTTPGASTPASLPPGVTPPPSAQASQPVEPTTPPPSDPTAPTPPPVTPEPTPRSPQPTPLPTPEPTSEPNPTGECADGIDNDGDLLVDLLDPGCVLGLRNSESLL